MPLYRSGTSDNRVTLGVAGRYDGKTWGLPEHERRSDAGHVCQPPWHVWSVSVGLLRTFRASSETVIRLVKTKSPDRLCGTGGPHVPAELWSVPIRARGQKPSTSARAKVLSTDPAFISAIRATGARAGFDAANHRRCGRSRDRSRRRVLDDWSRGVGASWGAFSVERIVEGPFRVYRALASMLPWDAIRFKIRLRRDRMPVLLWPVIRWHSWSVRS